MISGYNPLQGFAAKNMVSKKDQPSTGIRQSDRKYFRL
jgi:hypothetical protein